MPKAMTLVEMLTTAPPTEGLPAKTPGGAETFVSPGPTGRGWRHLMLLRDCLPPCDPATAAIVYAVARYQYDSYLVERGRRPRGMLSHNNEQAHPQWSMPVRKDELTKLFGVLVAVESGDFEPARAWLGGERPEIVVDPMEVYVYRRSAGGEVLYVGISYDHRLRGKQHRAMRAAWMMHWQHLEVHRVSGREAALALEKELIRTLHPKHNVQHNDSPPPRPPRLQHGSHPFP